MMRTRRLSVPRRLSAVLLPALLAACGGGPATPGGSPAATASEKEWRALALPRPEPLQGAARVSVGAVRLVTGDPWSLHTSLEPDVWMSELVATGLIRRRDVQFVERRRFGAEAERVRRGQPRQPGAPPVGVSPGAEFVVTATWARLGLDSAYVDVRLADAQSGNVVRTWRGATANDPDPVSVARLVVRGTLEALAAMDRLPAWNDPEAAAAPGAYRPSGVPLDAVQAFLEGLAAEERWRWEPARRGYQKALAAAPAFVEAREALSRTARLRMGGTLGAS